VTPIGPKSVINESLLLLLLLSVTFNNEEAPSGLWVESIDPLHFLARCRKMQLNQALFCPLS